MESSQYNLGLNKFNYILDIGLVRDSGLFGALRKVADLLDKNT